MRKTFCAKIYFFSKKIEMDYNVCKTLYLILFYELFVNCAKINTPEIRSYCCAKISTREILLYCYYAKISTREIASFFTTRKLMYTKINVCEN